MNTKELILEEALKQFSQKGYDGTSMSDIVIKESEEKYRDFLAKLSVHFLKDSGDKMNKNDLL